MMRGEREERERHRERKRERERERDRERKRESKSHQTEEALLSLRNVPLGQRDRRQIR